MQTKTISAFLSNCLLIYSLCQLWAISQYVQIEKVKLYLSFVYLDKNSSANGVICFVEIS
jgi:hypothetical protein